MNSYRDLVILIPDNFHGFISCNSYFIFVFITFLSSCRFRKTVLVVLFERHFNFLHGLIFA